MQRDPHRWMINEASNIQNGSVHTVERLRKRNQKCNAFEYGNAEKRSIVFQPDVMSHSLQADKTINSIH